MLHQGRMITGSRQAWVTRQRFTLAGAIVVAAILPSVLPLVVLPDPKYFNTS